jgi:nitrogen regulatory protein PII
MNCEEDVELIVTVVRKGWGEVALKASVDAGAQGGTVMYGRGTGIHEQKTLLGIRIEPEKEILLTVVQRGISEKVLDAINEAVELEKPGTGIAMIVPLRKVIGRCHMMPFDDG